MSDRVFTKAEIKKAETLLLTLANESSRFWAKAFLSPSFLYQGRVYYINSDFYKSSCWKDAPNDDHDPITAEQIMNFIETYMAVCKNTIEKIINSDTQVAKILGMEKRINLPHNNAEYNFGAWDNDPWGAVAIAKKAAGLDGPMSISSEYRKTEIILEHGKLYKLHYGNKKFISEIDIQED